MSFTSDEPESLVRNVAWPKSKIKILYIVIPILWGEYHGESNPSAFVRWSICSWTNASNSSTLAKLSAIAGFSVISALTWKTTPCFRIVSMLEPTRIIVKSSVAIRTPNMVISLVPTYFFRPTWHLLVWLYYNYRLILF